MSLSAFFRFPALRVVSGTGGVGAAAGAACAAGPRVLAAWLLPDVALLYGMSRELAAQGWLAPRAVPAYNALHSLYGPFALAAAGVVSGGGLVLGLGLVWGSHVLVDRACGFGLRARDGRQRG
jgi:hypothetical protein